MIDPLIGQTLGQYELQDRLGRGGMASVYRALQPSLGRAVAIKVLPLDQLGDPTLPERFRREARMAANLLHPNIVPVYDFGEWQDHLFIVMALITGGTLKDRMQGPLPVEAAVRLVGQVADGLGYAHAQGVVHRDIKPTNVLLAAGDWAMLSDFGIARALGETTRLTGPYGTLGTPVYMAPEQWVGGEVDGRADLYSLGIVLYELLTGGPPFAATTSEGLMRQHLEMPVPALASRRPDLPSGLEDVIKTALAKEPERRYRHAGELKAALEAAARQDPAPGLHTSTNLAATGRAPTTHPFLGPTMRAVDQLRIVEPAPQQHGRGGTPTVVLVLLLAFALLAGAVGYMMAVGRSELSISPSPTSTIESAAVPVVSTATPGPQQTAPTLPAPTTGPTNVSEAPAAPPRAADPTTSSVLPQPTTAEFWTVCVWCDEGSHDPRSGAEQIAGQLRAAELPAAILWSTDYPSLNADYWVTYSGTFDSERAATDHLGRVRSAGFAGRVRFAGRLPRGSPPSVGQQTPNERPFWAVIVGSFGTRSEAETHAAQLRSRGLSPMVLFSSDYAGLSPGFWITYVGPFADRAVAVQEAQRLVSMGIAGANAREIRR